MGTLFCLLLYTLPVHGLLYTAMSGIFVNDFTVKLPCKVAVKSFGSRSAMGTLFCLLLYLSCLAVARVIRTIPNVLYSKL